ncbi:hypothetical protein Cgig2_027245 [Carnegiea gigantea]|uniref:Uncharacterized protein n=1 Tax=Carnegiea gigantea TaxID=171969 RepID=A0A9Q1K232_9CARY|nr:hypothetical protein Cgig2_027245 [Carnegiea gigantea]
MLFLCSTCYCLIVYFPLFFTGVLAHRDLLFLCSYCAVRAEELEFALMEMVKQDNRRQLSARVEQLEQEVAELRRAVAEKQEQENAMLQVLMRVEQEQKVTEDARRFAEQEAASQRDAAQVLQHHMPYPLAPTLKDREQRKRKKNIRKRVLSAWSHDELCYVSDEIRSEVPLPVVTGQPANTEESSDGKPTGEVQSPILLRKESNGDQTPEKQ